MLASTSAVQAMIGASGVDRGVAGQHADVGRSEDAAQGEELLADQRLDRGGVVAAPSGRQGRVLAPVATSDLPSRWRRQDDVRAADQLDQRLLLRRVERACRRLGPGGEGGEQLVGVVGAGAQGGEVAGVVEEGEGRGRGHRRPACPMSSTPRRVSAGHGTATTGPGTHGPRRWGIKVNNE
jgi:hypothetical protein